MTTLENFYFGNITPSEYKQSNEVRKQKDFLFKNYGSTKSRSDRTDH